MKPNGVLISCIAAIVAFAIGFGIVAIIKAGTKNNPEAPQKTTSENVKRDSVVLDLKNMTESIVVAQRSFFPNNNALYEKLNLIKYGLEKGLFDQKTLSSELEAALRELEQLGYYYDYIDKAFVTSSDGTVYGAKADEKGPIGGGKGYKDIITKGTYTVTDDNTFYAACAKAKSGDVIFVKNDAVIDITDMSITDYPNLTIKEGVTIASDRGNGNSCGGVLKFSLQVSIMFKTFNNVRITGLVLQGNDGTTHEGEEKYYGTIGFVAQGDGVEIDNCEISGFNTTGINCTVGNTYIHHCYIHDIKGEGYGNGISVAKSAVKLESNLFSNCRNCVNVTGAVNGSLEAINNIEVGNSLGSMFVIKGGATKSDAVPEMKTSCASVILRNNTVLGSTPFVRFEGLPSYVLIENNLFSLNEDQYDAEAMYGPADAREGLKGCISFRNNAFNILDPYAATYCDSAKAPAAETGEGAGN